MKYIGLNNTEVNYGSIVTVRRDLCFTLDDPGTFDTNKFIRILFRKAGAIIESVEIFNAYHNPDTGVLTHTYHLTFRCNNTGSKAGYGFPVERLNPLMHEIELELEASLPVHVANYHTIGKRNKTSLELLDENQTHD